LCVPGFLRCDLLARGNRLQRAGAPIIRISAWSPVGRGCPRLHGAHHLERALLSGPSAAGRDSADALGVALGAGDQPDRALRRAGRIGSGARLAPAWSAGRKESAENLVDLFLRGRNDAMVRGDDWKQLGFRSRRLGARDTALPQRIIRPGATLAAGLPDRCGGLGAQRSCPRDAAVRAAAPLPRPGTGRPEMDDTGMGACGRDLRRYERGAIRNRLRPDPLDLLLD